MESKFELVTGGYNKWLHWSFDEDEKEKISIRINTVFEKKSPGIEVEYTKSKKKVHYYINR
jgi:hypothetical protein